MKKKHLTPKKMQQKVFQQFFVALGVLNNILKVYQNQPPTMNVITDESLGPIDFTV